MDNPGRAGGLQEGWGQGACRVAMWAEQWGSERTEGLKTGPGCSVVPLGKLGPSFPRIFSCIVLGEKRGMSIRFGSQEGGSSHSSSKAPWQPGLVTAWGKGAQQGACVRCFL